MKISTPEIAWHERDPIYSCAYHPIKTNVLATAGVSGIIRLWEINHSEDKVNVEFLANLKRHVKAVNVIRWNHDGLMMASAGDEGVIMLWNENDIKNQKTLDNDEDESKENWFAFKTLRGHLEDVLDLCWSSDSSILISGSVDNSAIVWNVQAGTKITIIRDPQGFVQGVAFDPLGSFYAIISTDRSLRFYNASSNKRISNVNKITMNRENGEPTNIRLFHDDTMKSFFRRICFSFDGNFVFAPSGCLELEDKIINTSFIFTRNCLTKPCLYIPHDKPSVAVAVCPLKFQLMKNAEKDNTEAKTTENVFSLPYRLVFAIATEDSIYFYDTQHLVPFASVTGIHYSNLTDITWTLDGQILTVSSIDGFCTFISFKDSELGEIYIQAEIIEDKDVASKTSSQCNEKQNEIKTLFLNQTTKANKIDISDVEIVEAKTEIKDNVKTLTFTSTKSNSNKNKIDISDVEIVETKPEIKENVKTLTFTSTKSNSNNKEPKRIKLIPLS